MLKRGLQIIVQYPDRAAVQRLICRGFLDVHSVTPIFVAFVGMSNQSDLFARDLGKEFCGRLTSLGATRELNPGMPCGGSSPVVEPSCHALGVPECRKLLILVGDGMVPPLAPSIANFPACVGRWLSAMRTDDTWDILAALPAMVPGTTTPTPVTTVLPKELQKGNVALWTFDPVAEVLPGVFYRCGLAPEDFRIFISYIRKETTELADQLFEELEKAGFDVFVDRFSVPVGVDFQERLTQDLTDKAMLLLLHSPSLDASPWVAYEIATAKKYRLGVYALVLPGVKPRSDLDPDQTWPLQGSQYDATTGVLSPTALRDIIQDVKRVHTEALHRRWQQLADSFAAAMTDPAIASRLSVQVAPGGIFLVKPVPGPAGAQEYAIHLTARPPELGDFYHTDVAGSVQVSSRRGGIIAPAPFLVATRRDQFQWLSLQSNIRHVDEGQLINAAEEMASGKF